MGSVVLREAPLFRGMSEGDFQELLACLREHRVASGEVVFEQGQPGDAMVIVAEGRLTVRITTPDGHSRDVGEIRPGGVVGEMACLDNELRSATVIAAEPSLLLELDRGLLRAISAHAPTAAMALVQGIVDQVSRRLRLTNASIAKLAIKRGGAAHTAPTEESIDGQRPAPSNLRAMAKEALGSDPTDAPGALSVADLDRLLDLARPALFSHGEALCREGELGINTFAILHGRVEVRQQLDDGDRLLAVLDAGSIVGQLSPVDALPRTATVTALGQVVALDINWEVFQTLGRMGDPLAARLHERIALATVQQLRMANTVLSWEALAAADEPDDVAEVAPPQMGRVRHRRPGVEARRASAAASSRAMAPPPMWSSPVLEAKTMARVAEPPAPVAPPGARHPEDRPQQRRVLRQLLSEAPTLNEEIVSLKKRPLAMVLARARAEARTGWLEVASPQVHYRIRLEDGLPTALHQMPKPDERLLWTAAGSVGINLDAHADGVRRAWATDAPEQRLLAEQTLPRGPAQRLMSRRISIQLASALDRGWVGRGIFRPDWKVGPAKERLRPSPPIPLPRLVMGAIRRRAFGPAQAEALRWLNKQALGSLKLAADIPPDLVDPDDRGPFTAWVEQALNAPNEALANAQERASEEGAAALWTLRLMGVIQAA